jgi:Beta-galactosidase jelly roll domain
LPEGQDVPVALRLAGSSGPWRALVFLNGWNVGQYLNQRGPQHDFALPAGLLRQRGENTLALAVIAQDDAVVGPVQLVTMGNHRGGVPVRAVPAPSYDPRSFDE